MKSDLGGGIRAAEGPGTPDMRAPRLGMGKKAPKRMEMPKKPMPERRAEAPKIIGRRKKPKEPGRVTLFWNWLKPHLKTLKRIVKSSEFVVVAVVLLAHVIGVALQWWYSTIYAYVLMGALASLVIYRMYSSVIKERDELKKEKDRLKLLEDRSRVLLENALDCVFTLDIQGNITSFNRKAERVTGYTKKDVLGQSFGLFLTQEEIKDFFDKLQRAIRTGVVPNYTLEINTIYGRRNFEMNLAAIRAGKKVIGVQGIGRDITDKKRLEKELKIATSDLERWSRRTVKKEMTILEMKNQIKAIKRELEAYSAGNN